MAILEYKLKATNLGMVCPPWVEDGGYFRNPDDFTLIGWARDNAEWYTPDTVIVLTSQDLMNRQLALHAAYPQSDENGVVRSEAEAAEEVTRWLSEREEL